MALKDVFQTFVDAIEDLSSLDVLTFTGTLETDVTDENGEDVTDWVEILERSRAAGKVKLMLGSHFRCDGDADLFVAQADIPADLRAAHKDAVDAGRQIRKDVLDLFADTLKKIAGV